ncbi:hypothetical protein NEMBOFW57_010250 [Staphylotrichum longicolle]|uniref:Uncharacterized protein n=1 Tax=Staphylotrichum longicolle TaxID=669026 RepID=A0AAD4EQQ8_9PEZI|nr:hypothetical protein NEMBOFW57_010250 [Staphylotrichum longicolle]
MTIGYFTAAPASTAEVCEGSTYAIQASDDCYSISRSQGVGTSWPLADNNLEAFYTKFPAAGTFLHHQQVHHCSRISLVDFLFPNPAANANCINLFAFESHWVAAVGDINTYIGLAGYAAIIFHPSVPFTGIPYTERLDATASPDAVHVPPLRPRPRVMTANYELAAVTYNVDLGVFSLWNPGLRNVSDPVCAFETGVRCYGLWYLQERGATPTNASPTPPGPTMSGSPADCNEWIIITDGLSCTGLASEAGRE